MKIVVITKPVASKFKLAYFVGDEVDADKVDKTTADLLMDAVDAGYAKVKRTKSTVKKSDD